MEEEEVQNNFKLWKDSVIDRMSKLEKEALEKESKFEMMQLELLIRKKQILEIIIKSLETCMADPGYFDKLGLNIVLKDEIIKLFSKSERENLGFLFRC